MPLFFQKLKLNSPNIKASYWQSNFQFVIVELYNDLKTRFFVTSRFKNNYEKEQQLHVLLI